MHQIFMIIYINISNIVQYNEKKIYKFIIIEYKDIVSILKVVLSKINNMINNCNKNLQYQHQR